MLATYGGRFAYWPYQLAVIYLPILVYGTLVLPQHFPKTENAEVGIPVGEMFRYTLTSPLFLLLLAMMAITTSIELGPMRWVPAVLEAVGMHGILVLVWISGWMVVLRLLASHFVERLAPTGMLLTAAVLTGTRPLPSEFRAGAVVGAGRRDDLRVGRGVLLPDDGGAGERAVAADRIARDRADRGHRPRHGGRRRRAADGTHGRRISRRGLDPAQDAGRAQRVEQRFPAYAGERTARRDGHAIARQRRAATR